MSRLRFLLLLLATAGTVAFVRPVDVEQCPYCDTGLPGCALLQCNEWACQHCYYICDGGVRCEYSPDCHPEFECG